jgi:hypothetical protein
VAIVNEALQGGRVGQTHLPTSANSLAQRQSVSTVLDRLPLLTIDMGQKLGEDVLVLNEISIISE